jgi:hypothetical protein
MLCPSNRMEDDPVQSGIEEPSSTTTGTYIMFTNLKKVLKPAFRLSCKKMVEVHINWNPYVCQYTAASLTSDHLL